MLIVVTSACTGSALRRTRGVVDLYLERIGARTWRGHLTEEAFTRLRQELSAVASKASAVAAHLVKSRKRMELQWIVGSPRLYSESGQFSTYEGEAYKKYLTPHGRRDMLAYRDLGVIIELASLWHDVGKANAEFLTKLKTNARSADTVRHEILSTLAFLRFCELAKGTTIDEGRAQEILQQVVRTPFCFHGPEQEIDLRPSWLPYPFQLAAWLIATHHRLLDAEPDPLKPITFRIANHVNPEKLTGPISISLDARIVTSRLAREMCRLYNAAQQVAGEGRLSGWRVDSVYGRIALVLADHLVSRAPACDAAWHDGRLPSRDDLLANLIAATEITPPMPKQTLEEHLLKVSSESRLTHGDIADWQGSAPVLASIALPQAIRSASTGRFTWQSDAAASVGRLADPDHGFFCAIVAGTGAGKTRAIPKIMAARPGGIRYSLALSLRSLTLQAGDDYYELGFDKSEVAVLIGDAAIQRIHEKWAREAASETGSETATTLAHDLIFADPEAPESSSDVDGEDAAGGEIEDVPGQWRLPHQIGRHFARHEYRAAERYLATPILISTIDQLMAAADGRRTSYLIDALRLMTSDLVIDEVDNFEAMDLVAIGRLVYLAGLFGRGVTIASATIPPSLAAGFHRSYQAGYFAHAAANGKKLRIDSFIFTNDGASAAERAVHIAGDAGDFEAAYRRVCTASIDRIGQAPVLRRGVVLPTPAGPGKPRHVLYRDIVGSLAGLHAERGTLDRRSGRRLSVHLVKFNHVNTCGHFTTWFAHNYRAIIADDVDVKLIVYHARFPLLQRSNIERHLDQLLRRRHEDIFRRDFPRRLMRDAKGRDVMVFVVTTSIIETGRDYDFDGVSAEPCDSRSLAQCAGRQERHRQRETRGPNFFLMPSVMLKIDGKSREFIYRNPGPEGLEASISPDAFRLPSPWVADLVAPEDLQSITAAPRLDEGTSGDLAALEHRRLQAYLGGSSYFSLDSYHASPANPFLASAHAERMRFRKSAGDLALYYDPEAQVFRSYNRDESTTDSQASEVECREADDALAIISPIQTDPRALLSEFAGQSLFSPPGANSKRIRRLARRFLRVSLPAYGDESPLTHFYDPILGLIRPDDGE